MFKLLITIVLVINDVQSYRHIEAKIDDFLQEVEYPLVDLVNYLPFCKYYSNPFHNLVPLVTSGIYRRLATRAALGIITTYGPHADPWCQAIELGGIRFAMRIQAGLAQDLFEAYQVKMSFLSVLHKRFKVGSVSPLPLLTCYLRKYAQTILATFRVPEAREYMRRELGNTFGHIIRFLERSTEPALSHCVIPRAYKNHSPYKSTLAAVFQAISNVQDNY